MLHEHPLSITGLLLTFVTTIAAVDLARGGFQTP